MESAKIRTFMQLAGQKLETTEADSPEDLRKLGAHLLLSEVLEYIIKGLKVHPVINGVEVSNPEDVQYKEKGLPSDRLEMLDGLADVAYTMYWNSEAFGLPLEEAFERVCDNNLEKFVVLLDWKEESRPLERSEWHCGQQVTWPEEVVEVTVIELDEKFYAVGKDERGKVRKPSSYQSVELSDLVN